jgi:hypothetical protein
MPNDVFDAAATVMAIREYADSPLPDDLARRVVEAGRLTASASNKQPWHFVLVRESWPWSSLGFPKRKVIGRKKRKAPEEVFSVERFGRRLSG